MCLAGKKTEKFSFKNLKKKEIVLLCLWDRSFMIESAVPENLYGSMK